jgi:hypothetical protein
MRHRVFDGGNGPAMREVGMYDIDKGIAPPVTIRRGSANKYPWKLLEVGDSFLVPHTGLPKAGLSTIKQQCWHAGKVNHKVFVALKVDDGVRVWCTEYTE